MKYLKNEAGDLVNIAQAQYIVVSPIEEPEGVATHAVMVIFENESSDWLYSGSEQDCRDFLNGVWARLEREGT